MAPSSPRIARVLSRLPAGLPSSSWPYFDQDEIEAAARLLALGKVNYWTGTEGKEF
jgi:hypothetical protein